MFSMPIIRFQPAAPSAAETISIVSIWVRGSHSPPPIERGAATLYRPAAAMAVATRAGRRRSRSASSAHSRIASCRWRFPSRRAQLRDPWRSQRSCVLARRGMVCDELSRWRRRPRRREARARRQRGRRGDRRRAVLGRRRAVHDRHRRRLLHDDLSAREVRTLRPERQRPRAARGDPRGDRARGLDACRAGILSVTVPGAVDAWETLGTLRRAAARRRARAGDRAAERASR